MNKLEKMVLYRNLIAGGMSPEEALREVKARKPGDLADVFVIDANGDKQPHKGRIAVIALDNAENKTA